MPQASNVLLAQDMTAKVCDFGMAKHRSFSTSTKGHKGGTAHWKAPEAFRRTFSQASDVWAFSATLYELLTLKIPYEGKEDHQVLFWYCVSVKIDE